MSAPAVAVDAAAPGRVGWDWWLVGIAVLLFFGGNLAILTAGPSIGELGGGDGAWFVKRQLAGAGLGALIGAWIATMRPADLRRRGALPFWLLCLALMALVFVPGIGTEVNGARRWIDLGPVNFQPSELAKLGVILMVAAYLSANAGRLRDALGVALPALAWVLVPVALAVGQKDMGAIVIFIGLGGVLLFLAGLDRQWVVALIASAGAAFVALVVTQPYRMARIASFTDPFGDIQGSGYQIVQGWIALATGGALGSGVGRGVAQRGFLPEAHTDMIAAVVGEELGVVGIGLLVGLMMLLVARTLRVASRARDLYGLLVASGIAALFAAQAVINLGVVGGLLPAKGLVLPFFSSGASAVLVHTMAFGVLLHVERDGRVAA
jgi:cell division protein FtsW